MNRTFVLIACLIMIACGDSSNDPNAVARHYWAAVQKNDQATIKQYSVLAEPKVKVSVFSSKTTIEGDKLQEIRFGETVVNKDVAHVPTTIILEPDDQPGRADIGEISFDTQLVQVDGEWKVEKTVTDKNMMGAAFVAAMAAMGEAFSESMKEAVESIGEAVGEGMKVMVEELAEGLAEGLDAANEAVDKMPDLVGSNQYAPPVVLPARVSGSISGTGVELSSAVWTNTLAIYSGEGWRFNPGLLIFLFLAEGEIPAARTITVKADDKSFGHPHVHYRWRDPENGDLKTEVVTGGYDMMLKFGEAIDHRVSGEIQFSMPEEDTRVAGTFEIELAQ